MRKMARLGRALEVQCRGAYGKRGGTGDERRGAIERWREAGKVTLLHGEREAREGEREAGKGGCERAPGLSARGLVR